MSAVSAVLKKIQIFHFTINNSLVTIISINVHNFKLNFLEQYFEDNVFLHSMEQIGKLGLI